ncbi:MAG: SUMF1/EgtB/PvdO family nonheme iron enzyme [Bdellovibrionota bacterium]
MKRLAKGLLTLACVTFGGASPAFSQAALPPAAVGEVPPPLSIPWRPVQEILEGMVRVPGGPFLRGASGGKTDEQPARKASLGAYYIDRTEVSAAKYQECSDLGACTPARIYPEESGPDSPVTGVSWFQARDYCLWRGKRLPTEAEWEKAARGDTGWRFPWGDLFDPKRANGADTADDGTLGGTDGFAALAPVESFPDGASPYGILQMAGNVSEWVLDWYDPEYYRRGPIKNPRGPSTGTQKVVRGGSWNDVQRAETGDLRATSRTPLDFNAARAFIGFRCAWVAEEDLTHVGDPELPKKSSR